jgi:hypothetical protein
MKLHLYDFKLMGTFMGKFPLAHEGFWFFGINGFWNFLRKPLKFLDQGRT